MRICIVSDNTRIAAKLKGFAKDAKPEVLPLAQLKQVLGCTEPLLVYVDLHKLDAAAWKRHARQLFNAPRAAVAVIDSPGLIDDPAELFHRGAVDFISKKLWAAGLTQRRLTRVEGFTRQLQLTEAGEPEPVLARNHIVAEDWDAVHSGNEYSFYFLFIELDERDDMEKKYGLDNLSAALASFREYVEDYAEDFGGKLWIWSKFGGIVLFPFDGRPTEAVACGFRFMLFKHMYDIEESAFPGFISLRMGMHLGNIVYRARATSQVVSDSLNSTFHLGQQYCQPGDFCITEEVLAYCPPELEPYFVANGEFEGRRVYRMKKLLT